MNKPLRLGFIGAGGISREHRYAIHGRDRLRAILKIIERRREDLILVEGAEISAVFDPNPEAARFMSVTTGAKIFPTAKSLVEESGVDAIFICVPPFAHGEAERLALGAGIPFFCEKPVGLDVGLIKEIAQEVERTGLITSVGYMSRYRTNVLNAREAFSQDPPVLASAGWYGGEPGPYTWWTNNSRSGGQMHEVGTHLIDIARFLFGEAESVFAMSTKQFNRSIPGYETEDAVSAVIKFKNGGIANIMTSCCSNARSEIFFNIHSKKAAFAFRDFEFNADIYKKGQPKQSSSGEFGIFTKEDQAFVDAVRTKDQSKVLCSYGDGAKSALLSLATIRSMNSGQMEAADSE